MLHASDVSALEVVANVNHGLTFSDPWLSLEAGAKHAGNVHPVTLRRAIKSGKLRAARINNGRVFRLRASWIDAWLEAGI